MTALLKHEPAISGLTRDVVNPFDGTVVGSVPWTDGLSVPMLLAKATAAAAIARRLPRHERAAILERAASRIHEESEDFARLIVAEAGKTIRQARKEVARCCNTLKLSAEEAKRNAGEVIPFDSFAGSENRMGWFTREPLGLIVAITPYNDPLNLVAHKLGPAIAGGNAVILKPSELAPLSAFRLLETLRQSGLHEDIVTVVAGGAELGRAIVGAANVRMISFTGGFETGRAIATAAGLKKLAMDLGGNAPVIVLEDADVEACVEACVSGAFWAAGQNCIGTQRILVARPLCDRFLESFVASTQRLTVGDPADELTDVGPMITERQAIKTIERIEAAVRAGATVLTGGERAGNLVWPTVLVNVAHEACLWRDEAFAPVVSIEPFDNLELAVSMANSMDYSLHAGIFTADLDLAFELVERIDAGGVMVNDSSDYRFDAMPFGGFKYGSLGREGVRFAYEDMTQPKVVCVNRRQRAG